ncbi:MAG: hypothetical protein ACKO85_16320, partial [Isosphaeraceae bacterium]
MGLAADGNVWNGSVRLKCGSDALVRRLRGESGLKMVQTNCPDRIGGGGRVTSHGSGADALEPGIIACLNSGQAVISGCDAER